jgi:large subunit ribosomal protein L35
VGKDSHRELSPPLAGYSGRQHPKLGSLRLSVMAVVNVKNAPPRPSAQTPFFSIVGEHEQDGTSMPKLKTHKGMKKRFKVSANGKVQHKKCGSSHLMSHKNGKQVRRLRKKSTLNVSAETRRIRNAMLDRQAVNPLNVEAEKLAAHASAASTAGEPAHQGESGPSTS